MSRWVATKQHTETQIRKYIEFLCRSLKTDIFKLHNYYRTAIVFRNHN